MPFITVTREWCGYSRGYTVNEVEVTEEELAKIKSGEITDAGEYFWDGNEVTHCIVRDDTDTTDYSFDI